ncbi:MFS transporter [Chloroflexota bacterium]
MTEATSATFKPADFPRSVKRRNFLSLMGDYVLFGIAMAFLNPNIMPANFVAELGGGPMLIGLAGIAFKGFWRIPQLFFAHYVNQAERKKNLVIFPSIPGRLFFIPAGLLMIVVGPSQPGLLVLLMLGSTAMLGFFDGMAAVPWMDVIGSSLTNEARSWMFGISQAITGIVVAVIVAPLVRYILGAAGPAFPNNYAVILVITGVIYMVALLAYSFVKEGQSPPPKNSPSWREYRHFLGQIMREDQGFRRYAIMFIFYEFSNIALPFYIVFATTIMGQASGVAISNQILIMTVTAALTALVMGRINQRIGPRYVILIATVAAVLAPLSILSTSVIGPLGLALLWVMVGITQASFVPGFLNWVVEYAPEGYRPIYSGLANTIGAVALVAPLLGGLIVGRFSYEAAFVVAFILASTALLLALRLPEPRRSEQ